MYVHTTLAPLNIIMKIACYFEQSSVKRLLIKHCCDNDKLFESYCNQVGGYHPRLYS